MPCDGFQMSSLCLLAILIGSALAQWEANTAYNRQAIVQLLEWKWTDIADECERFVRNNPATAVLPPVCKHAS